VTEDGAAADHLRHGQPRPGDHPARSQGARPDAIVATGRSDYPNQVNNVLGFPSSSAARWTCARPPINDEMKIAAANALAELAREAVPEEVAAAYGGVSQRFGADYIIPAPFDPRLMEWCPAAVAEAAMRSGVAQRPIENFAVYRQSLRARLNPTVSVLSLAYERHEPIPSACCLRKARSTWCCAPPSPSRKAAMARRCWSGATTCMTGCGSSGSMTRRATKC
jgi:malate dehydrogenase (oxaloacetate-decarboxylating)(NADP+)